MYKSTYNYRNKFGADIIPNILTSKTSFLELAWVTGLPLVWVELVLKVERQILPWLLRTVL